MFAYSVSLSKPTIIKNMIIEGSVSAGATTGNYGVGAIYGLWMDAGTLTIENVINNANVSNTSSGAAVTGTGGFVGYLRSNNATLNIKKSYNYGTLNAAKGTAGGFLGYTDDTIYINVENCGNFGTINTVNNAAGILYTKNNKPGVVSIKKCFNATDEIYGTQIAAIMYGGYSPTVTVEDCFNTGDLFDNATDGNN